MQPCSGPVNGTFCEEGFDCKSSDPSAMGAPGVCTKKAETLIAQEGEMCNPTLGPVNGIFCEVGFDCKSSDPSAVGAPGVCTKKAETLIAQEGETCNPTLGPVDGIFCEKGVTCKSFHPGQAGRSQCVHEGGASSTRIPMRRLARVGDCFRVLRRALRA